MAPIAETVQINARMNRTLRDEGETALASIGLSPSEAIRALWTKAAKRGADLQAVRSLLADEPAMDPECARKLEAFDRARREISQAMRDLGIDSDVPWPNLTDEELLEEELYERMRERGLA